MWEEDGNREEEYSGQNRSELIETVLPITPDTQRVFRGIEFCFQGTEENL